MAVTTGNLVDPKVALDPTSACSKSEEHTSSNWRLVDWS